MMVILINHGTEPLHIEVGDRIAQLVIVAIPEVRFEEVEELADSDRGVSGFGSTGGFADGRGGG
jgi:dUTP pyrophosphatase